MGPNIPSNEEGFRPVKDPVRSNSVSSLVLGVAPEPEEEEEEEDMGFDLFD